MPISKAQIGLVKTAQAKLARIGVDEDAFRDIMFQETGVRSTPLIPDNAALNRLLKRLSKLGFESTSTTSGGSHSPDDPITRKQKWRIARNYERMGYDTEERRQGFNQHQCGELPWGQPQTLEHGQKIIDGQMAILRRVGNNAPRHQSDAKEVQPMTTPLDDFQKCPSCDAMVDPASLADVFFHLVDGGCVNPKVPRREELEGIRGEKVSDDA